MSRLCHWEIPSTNLKRSAEFYRKLFGWKMQGWSPDYMLFSVKGGVDGAISKVEKMPKPGIMVYIAVRDMPASLKKVQQLGGKVVQPKTEIGGGMGFMAFFVDPCGCRIGLWSRR